MTTATTARPEDRQRSGSDSAPWADMLPACFRSEAFAEDLDGPTEAAAPLRAPAAATGSRPGLAAG